MLTLNLLPIRQQTSFDDLKQLYLLLLNERQQLQNEKRQDRQRIASKLKKARQIERKRLRVKALDKFEADLSAEKKRIISAVFKQCYQDSLQTIKTVCLAVFAENPAEALVPLLEARMKQVLAELELNKIKDVKLPPQLLAKLDPSLLAIDHDQMNLCITTACGKIVVDPLKDLEQGFMQLQAKLQQGFTEEVII